jgi:hypothetical protein
LDVDREGPKSYFEDLFSNKYWYVVKGMNRHGRNEILKFQLKRKLIEYRSKLKTSLTIPYLNK